MAGGVPLPALPTAAVARPGGDGLLRWYFDTNRNPNAEATTAFGLVSAGDVPLLGDINGDGRIEVVVVRPQADGLLHWYVDLDGDPEAESHFAFGLSLANDIPVLGDINGDGTAEPGVVRPGGDGLLHWYFDTNRDPNAEIQFAFGLASTGDVPVLGDRTGDRTAEPGVVRPGGDGLLHWYFDTNRDPNAEIQAAFGLVGDVPVLGDPDGNRTMNLGVVRPGGDGLLHWYYDTNNDPNAEVQFGFGLVAAGDVLASGAAVRTAAPRPVRSGNTLSRQGQPLALRGYGDYGILSESSYDFRRHIDDLAARGLNLVRVWINYHWTQDLSPFTRVGTRYDLQAIDPRFVSRFRDLVAYAQTRGVLVQATLFDGVMLRSDSNGLNWARSPYNRANNVQGYDGSTSQFSRTDTPLWTRVNRPLIDRLVQAAGVYNNVVWEVMNEPEAHGVTGSAAERFHRAVTDEIVFASAGRGRGLISVNAGELNQSVYRFGRDNPNVDLLAFHVRYPYGNFAQYDAVPKPVVLSNDGDISEVNERLSAKESDENRRLSYLLRGDGRYQLAARFRTAALGRAPRGRYGIEFLDKVLNGDSWKTRNYDPSASRIDRRLLDVLAGS